MLCKSRLLTGPQIYEAKPLMLVSLAFFSLVPVPTVITVTKCRAQILKVMSFALKFWLLPKAQIKEL
jgi:hypothetical protein